MSVRRWTLTLMITLMLIDAWMHNAAAAAPSRESARCGGLVAPPPR